jgi:uncharacterized phosphosugar-binding protein
MSAAQAYLDAVRALLDEAAERNREAILTAARIVAATIARDGIVRTFGTGHSQLLALELVDRAGGFAPVDAILDPTFGRAENVDGYAASLLHEDQLRPPDCLIVASTSGRNRAPIDMALLARDRGLGVIAVTSVAFSRTVGSRHRSGLRLLDVADVVLDVGGEVGDAAVVLEGAAPRVGPTSTVIGAALLNAVIVEAAGDLAHRGVTPPVFVSQNVDGSEAHNTALEDRYRSRVRALR